MKLLKLLVYIIAVVIGLLMFIYAGVDDSPGGQLIGVVVVLTSIIFLLRERKNNKNKLFINKQ